MTTHPDGASDVTERTVCPPACGEKRIPKATKTNDKGAAARLGGGGARRLEAEREIVKELDGMNRVADKGGTFGLGHNAAAVIASAFFSKRTFFIMLDMVLSSNLPFLITPL